MGWLVDSWHGGGILEYEGIEPAAYIHELTIDARDGGPYLQISSRVWLAHEPAGVVDKEAPGQVTYDQLSKERLWSSHTGYIRVNPEAQQRADGASEIEAMIASPAGVAQAWVGLISGPRVQLLTDGIMRSASGAQIEGAKLMAGNVASDLFYAIDMEAFGSEMRSYMAGRLSRQFNDDVDAPEPSGADGAGTSGTDTATSGTATESDNS